MGDPLQLLIAHFLTGSARWLRGDLNLARKDFDKALALRDCCPHLTMDLTFGFDIGITALARQACVLWLLGHPDLALDCLQGSVSAAQERGHSITLALTRGMAGMIFSLMGGDTAAARQHVDALRQVSEAGLFLEPWADSLVSRSITQENQNEEDLQQMRQGLATFQTVGTPLGRAAQFCFWRRAMPKQIMWGQGLAALDEALTWMGQTGVRMLEAEAYRLRGELLLIGRP